MTTPNTRKRILRELHIGKIAAVDRPCQEHARMTLMKRADDDEEYDDMQIQKITRDEPVSFPTLGAAMDHLRKVRGMSGSDAMSAAAREHPELLAKYQQDGERIAKAAREAAKPRPVTKAEQDFQDRVDEIAKRDGIGRSGAMSKARAEFPTEFATYQEA